MSAPKQSRRRSEVQPQVGKVSEMILEFARPLLDAIGEPRDIRDLKAAFELVTVCWNLPVLGRIQSAEAVEHRQHFDSVVAAYPEPLASALRGLVESRTATFGAVPFMVLVEVRGNALDDCTIYAEARGDGPGQLLKPPN